MIPFDAGRIYIAIEKACKATAFDLKEIDILVEDVVSVLESLHEEYAVVGLEHVQDVVEKVLMKA
jgi:hypothetical protein